MRLLPEKADGPEDPIRMCRWKSTPEVRKMPKIPEPEEGGFVLFCGWLEKFDSGNSGQSESPALTKPPEELRAVKLRVAGETARLGSVAAL